MKWIGTWATTPVAVDGVSLANQTLRMIARVSLGGSQLRVRFSNAYGLRELHLAGAHVALRSSAAEIVPPSDRMLTFGGREYVDVPVGALVISDPVDLEVPALSDVAVSFYLPGEVPSSYAITGHGNAHQTSYISTPGNFVASLDMPVQEPTAAFLFLSGIDVLAPDDAGSIVTLGDSLTDCNISKLDANNRWPDQLARRLVARSGGRVLAVLNQGLGGNRILHDVRGESGLRRFDRDVLAQPGVSYAIVLLGINDIRNRSQLAQEAVSAEDMIGGLQQMIVRAHTRGIKIFGGTLLTFEHETFNPGFYTPEGEAKRQQVNAWIRDAGAFDAVIDFEAFLRDPEHRTRMLPLYDCGDHLHPSDAGYLHMGDCIDLSFFS